MIFGTLLSWSASLWLLPPSAQAPLQSRLAARALMAPSFGTRVPEQHPEAGGPSGKGARSPQHTPQGSCFHSRNESGCGFCAVAGFEPVHYTLGEVRDVFPLQEITSRLEPSASPCHDHQLVHVSTFSITHWRGRWWEAALVGNTLLIEERPPAPTNLRGSWGRKALSWGFWCFLQRDCWDLWGQPVDVTSVLDRLPALLHPTLRAPRQRQPPPLHRGGRGHPEVQPAL